MLALSPPDPAPSTSTLLVDCVAFTVDEEQDVLSDAEFDDLVQLPTLGLAEANSPPRPDHTSNATAQHEGYNNALLLSYDIESPTPAPPEAMTDRRCSMSSAPALSLTDSPHLFGRRAVRRASSAGLPVASLSTGSVSTYPTDTEPSTLLSSSVTTSARAGGASRKLAGWNTNDSPPARLSRSLSHTSGAAAWSAVGGGSGGSAGGGSGAGCAKVTGTAFRRRSRANSASSMMPMPVLETSSSFDSNHRAVAETTAGGSSSSWSHSRGFGLNFLGSGSGSGGGMRHDASIKRHSLSSFSGRFYGGSGEDNGTTAADGADGSADPMRVSRSQSHLPSGRTGTSAAHGGVLAAASSLHKRPMSLPKGLGLAEPGNAATESLSGDAAVGWVLRAPGTATSFGRHRSNSFASGRKGYLQARHLRSASLSATGGGGSPPSWQRQASSCSDRREAAEEENEGASEGGKQRLRSASSVADMGQSVGAAQTPQTSPTHSSSAARHRSNNLSSVARRMDRLEIRSPDVDTQAAQVCGRNGARQEIASIFFALNRGGLRCARPSLLLALMRRVFAARAAWQNTPIPSCAAAASFLG